jgi:hypothetical protein
MKFVEIFFLTNVKIQKSLLSTREKGENNEDKHHHTRCPQAIHR